MAQAKRISYLTRKAVNKATSDEGLTSELFNEMLNHAKLLLILRGGCSKLEIRMHFLNLKVSVVEAFINEAIKREIIHEVSPNTFMLSAA